MDSSNNQNNNDLYRGWDMEMNAFCTNIVAKKFEENGFKIECVLLKTKPTQVIASRNNKRYFVIVAGAIFPRMGKVSFSLKRNFVRFCKEQNAVPLLASMGLNSDNAQHSFYGIVDKKDGFTPVIPEPINLLNLTEPDPGSAEYQEYCLEMIINAFHTHDFTVIQDLFSDDINYYSFYDADLIQVATKEGVIDYLNQLGEMLRGTGSEMNGCVVMILGEKNDGKKHIIPISGSTEVLGALIRQDVKGSTLWYLYRITFDEHNRINKMILSEPTLTEFITYYTFE